MAAPKAIQLSLILLKDHPTLKEAWVEQQIVDNPGLLRLGEVEVRDRQRGQPRAGRLDLLLEDNEKKRRYEVEIQLGRCDESHIIRDRKSTRLNSSHLVISYAVFCLKKKIAL